MTLGIKRALYCSIAACGLMPMMSAAPCLHAADQAIAGMRIVDCDSKVQSRKRGICANELSKADFTALSPGVSWWYNWGTKPGRSLPPPEAGVEFIPMVWGDHPAAIVELKNYLRAGNRPRFVLGINEPNLRGQAFIPPAQAAALHTRIKAVTDAFNVPLIAPQMAIGSSPTESISAFDPIEKKQMTYGFMVPYLKAFLYFAGRGNPKQAKVGAISIHVYDDIYALRALVELAHRETALPIWVTEYAKQTSNMNVQREYLIRASDFLERTPYVQGYAWFKERVPPEVKENEALFEKQDGKLSPLGEAYVALPVHDSDIYYRLPGRLQAENYVSLSDSDIWPTHDADGFAHMASLADGATLKFNVYADKSGEYDISLRMTGLAGSVEILLDEKKIATLNISGVESSWKTFTTAAQLKNGAQILSIRMNKSGQGVNWIEFKAK